MTHAEPRSHNHSLRKPAWQDHDSQNRHLEGLSRATKLIHPFCPQFPTCLWCSGNSFDRLCSSCSGLIQVLPGEPKGNYSLLLCFSRPVSWLLGFWFFEKWSPNCRIILSISSTSPGLGGIGWDLMPGTSVASFSSILQEKKFNRRVAWLQEVGLSSWIMEIISKGQK